jgi:L-amino acid N-acyltransferase YncA
MTGPIKTAPITIAPMTAAHAADVLRIYQQGIDEGNATFETTAPTWDVFDAGKMAEHRFVALDADADADADLASRAKPAVLGYVVVSAISKRACYAGVVELSVYVALEARGRGVGNSLLSKLIESTEAAGIWTINAGVFPENTASLALHKRHGFRVLGRQERIGKTVAGVWRDVVLLERRSPVVD